MYFKNHDALYCCIQIYDPLSNAVPPRPSQRAIIQLKIHHDGAISLFIPSLTSS